MRLLLGASLLALVGVAPVAAQTAAPATATDPQAAPADAPGSTRTAPGDVIVTANPFGTETPTIVAKVNRRAILETGGDSIADALAGVPGISNTGFSPGSSRPVIRGQDAARVRVVENGTSSSDVSDIGADHGIPVDPLSAQSIEVVRGAATLRYGSQAIGGVINILNNRVPTELSSKPLSGEISGAFNSVSDTGEGTAMIDGSAGNIAAHADGFYRDAGDYDTPAGKEANSFFRGHSENLGATVFFGSDKDSHVGASIQQYDAKYGIPADTAYIDMRQTKVTTRSAFALGQGLLKSFNLDASYADYTHDEDDPDGTVVTTFRNKEADGRAELLLGGIGPVTNTAIGAEIQHREFSAVGADATYLFPTTTDTQAGYLFTDTPLGEAFRLQVAGRVEHVRVEGTPASDVRTVRDFTPISGSIGALYNLNATIKIGVTFSSTGRAPLMTELYARGGHDASSTFETGDPTLRIERANSLEATLRVNADRFRFEGSLYSSWFRNYIYGQLTGRTCDDDGVCQVGDDEELRELFYRQQGAWFRGAEAEAHFALFKTDTSRVELRAIADYTRATLDNGDNVPRIPPYRAGGGVDYQSDRFDAGVLFVHSGRQDQYGFLDTPTPSFNQLTAQATARLFTAYPGVSLSVVGQNLTDDIQRNAAALNKDDVILPGRNIRVVLRAAF